MRCTTLPRMNVYALHDNHLLLPASPPACMTHYCARAPKTRRPFRHRSFSLRLPPPIFLPAGMMLECSTSHRPPPPHSPLSLSSPLPVQNDAQHAQPRIGKEEEEEGLCIERPWFHRGGGRMRFYSARDGREGKLFTAGLPRAWRIVRHVHMLVQCLLHCTLELDLPYATCPNRQQATTV